MTRNRSWILATLVLLLGSMVATGPTATAAPGAEIRRPITVSLDFVSAEPLVDCDGDLIPAGFVGTGRLSHLGKVEITGGACNDFTTLALTDGFGTYVAANGDEIHVAYTAQAVVTTTGGFEGAGNSAITGGTGRFEDATGSFEFTFTTVFFPDGSSRTLTDGDGWISYAASNRSNS